MRANRTSDNATIEKVIEESIDNMPVSINNLYGDPTLQWDNTMEKLSSLGNHKGHVAVITRGLITKEMARRLKKLEIPKLTVIVSVSNLPKEIEPASKTDRYKTIENLTKEGVNVLVNVRPLIPDLNGTKESLEEMFRSIKEHGGKYVVVSGFRGDDNIVRSMNLDRKLEWSLRIKIMTKEMSRNIAELKDKYELNVQKRVSCGVANIYKERSHNPYFYAKSLLLCEKECELYSLGVCNEYHSVDGKKLDVQMKVLKKLGYELELKFFDGDPKICSVTSENRTACPSCCTACYVMKVPKIVIKNKNITLADTAFIRFFTGILATQPGIEDRGGDTGLAKVISKAVGKEVYLVNSWYVLAREQKECFRCTYCITEAYNLREREYGVHLKELKERIIEACK